MNVIFLDIDGVLNDHKTFIYKKQIREKTGEDILEVDDKKILLLKELIDATNAKIVLSSTWRIGWKDIELGIPNSSNAKDFIVLKEKLLEFGIELFDKTRILKTKRGKEIKLWLEQAQEPIESFIILDDDDDMEDLSKHHLVKTNFHKGGFTRPCLEKALKLFNRQLEENK